MGGDPERAEVIRELGGLKFRQVENSTIEHDIWMMRIAHRSGIDILEIRPGEEKGDFAVRVFWHLMESGLSVEVLTGILIPGELKDAEWTPRIAEKTAKFLRSLTDEADKRTMHAALVEYNAFFVHGLLWKDLSRTVSRNGKDPGAQPGTAEAVESVSSAISADGGL